MKRLLLSIALFAAALIFVGCGDEATTSTSQSLGNPPQQPALGGGETAPNTGGTVTPGNGSIPPPPGSVGDLGNLGSSGCAEMDLACICERIVSLYESCYGTADANDWNYCRSNELQHGFEGLCEDWELSTVDCWNTFDQVVSSCIGSSCGQCDIFGDTPKNDVSFD